MNIAILDCAIKRPSIMCFNRLVKHFNTPFTYHRPPIDILKSLIDDQNAKAYIIFGSASNIEERLTWHKNLAHFIDEKLKENKPVLGLCFGHQLMADFYGLNVVKNPCKQNLKGTRLVKFKANHLGFRTGEEYSLFKAHSFQIEGESQNLSKIGSSEECSWDVLIHNKYPFLGFQTHPEASMDFYENEILSNKVNISKTLLDKTLIDGLTILEQFISSID